MLPHFQNDQLWYKAVSDMLAGCIHAFCYAVLYEQLCTLTLTTPKLQEAFQQLDIA
jgi:hypothetical protein